MERIIATTTRAGWAMAVRVWVYFVGSKGSMTGVDVALEYGCFYFSGPFTLRHLDPNCLPNPLRTTSHTKCARRLRQALRLDGVRVWASLWKGQLRKISRDRHLYRLQFWVGLL